MEASRVDSNVCNLYRCVFVLVVSLEQLKRHVYIFSRGELLILTWAAFY